MKDYQRILFNVVATISVLLNAYGGSGFVKAPRLSKIARPKHSLHTPAVSPPPQSVPAASQVPARAEVPAQVPAREGTAQPVQMGPEPGHTGPWHARVDTGSISVTMATMSNGQTWCDRNSFLNACYQLRPDNSTARYPLLSSEPLEN